MRFPPWFKKRLPIFLLLLPLSLNADHPVIEIIISGASHAAGVENGISNPALKGALQGVNDAGVINCPHQLTYFGPHKITEVPKLMAHHSVYTHFLERDLFQYIQARKAVNQNGAIGVILPEFVWLRFVASYNQDTFSNIKNNDFDPVIDRDESSLLKFIGDFKRALFGQIYYHLQHRPGDISENSVAIKSSLESSIDQLEAMGKKLGVVFLVVGLPQQFKEIGALRENCVHIYEPLVNIIPNDSQTFVRHYLTFLLLYSPGEMEKLPRIQYWINHPPCFRDGFVEEINKFVQSCSQDKQYVRFYDMGDYLKQYGDRLALKLSESQRVLFKLNRIFNQGEKSPLHLYKGAYDLTAMLYLEALSLLVSESLGIDTSGLIDPERREELILRKKAEFQGEMVDSSL
ncbi:hypothetical protein [Endozoicomonas atrinae]|uniref:hypothetical protein n=1 Tax=Endozoicomonas atrinae TaxID=1333660 RepID=UPI0008242E08|nr:hypothetical protein [Endozoicomonas atrinae]